ncbi:hypothetical protein DFS34DRAFT_595215 [Phlyctochytrium arcticum]|nr:hypothetical protein DFS34DRAFT_595215 [Phlyctochytrium arcticum]
MRVGISTRNYQGPQTLLSILRPLACDNVLSWQFLLHIYQARKALPEVHMRLTAQFRIVSPLIGVCPMHVDGCQSSNSAIINPCKHSISALSPLEYCLRPLQSHATKKKSLCKFICTLCEQSSFPPEEFEEGPFYWWIQQIVYLPRSIHSQEPPVCALNTSQNRLSALNTSENSPVGHGEWVNPGASTARLDSVDESTFEICPRETKLAV